MVACNGRRGHLEILYDYGKNFSLQMNSRKTKRRKETFGLLYSRQ
jgi:hypothetical protein